MIPFHEIWDGDHGIIETFEIFIVGYLLFCLRLQDMSTLVLASGEEEKQEPDITIADLQRSYPGCWVIGTNGVALRRPASILQTGGRYTLHVPHANPAGIIFSKKSSVIRI